MRRRSIVISLLIVIPLFVWIGFWILQRQHYESTDNAYLKTNMVLISPKVQGYVTELLIDDNQVVKEGDVLVTIDDRDYQAQVERMEANQRVQQAHIRRLLAMKVVQKARIVGVEASIKAAQIRLTLLAKDLNRFKNLIQQGSTSVHSMDKIQTQFKQANAELNSLQAHLREEQGQLHTLDAEIEATQASLKSTQAQVLLAQLDLENTRVKAPVDGIIGHRGVQLGQLVRPGLTLCYLVERDKLWLEANFKETQLEFMHPGQAAKIYVDAYPHLTFYGKVDSFAPATGSEFSILPAENATGNFTKIVRRVPVKIRFDPGQNISLLRPGFSVVVQVKIH